MDFRDPSASMTASDEDAVLSVSAGLAKDAALLFQSRKFTECVDVLNQLLLNKKDDPKILHNIAIAEFFRDGYPNPKKLLEVLSNVQKRGEELARTSAELLEASSNLGNKIVSGSTGSHMTPQFSAANSGCIFFNDEFDTSVAALNIATIWFHLHDYAKAMAILEPLYNNIAPIDETTALHICLLLLDVALASRDASRAADVISYLEKAFGSDCPTDGGSATEQQSSNLVSKASISSNITTSDASNLDSAVNANTSEISLSRALSEETLEYDTLLSTLDIGGENLTRASGFPSSNDLSRTSTDRSDLKLKLQLYKIQLLLLTRNIKAAKREVKIAMNIARGGDSSMALVLKSQLEYARGNYRKAIKLLMASSNRTEAGPLSIFNNNLGCIHYQFGKPHTSTLFFSRALSNSSSLRREKPLNLLTFFQDKSLLITYNCGVQYLACGKPIMAARCFQKASMVFYNRPLLWLRIAECCLMAQEKGLLRSGADRSDIKALVIGKGKWRHLVVDDENARNGHVNSAERDNLTLGNGQPQLSMPLARQCLINALHLLECLDSKDLKRCLPYLFRSDEIETPPSVSTNQKNMSGLQLKSAFSSIEVDANGDTKDQKGGLIVSTALQNSISDYEVICRKENHMIKQAVLANLAYIELELKNPLKALATARSLVDCQLPECSKIYLFLARVYAAEALCLLNRIVEAADNLLIYLSEGNTVELPFSQQDCDHWRGEKAVDSEELHGGLVTGKCSPHEESQGIVFPKPEEAHGALYVNLAAMSAMQGDIEQAHQFSVQALSVIPKSPKAILMAVYVDLKLGKTEEAVAKLKHCNRVMFRPGVSH